MQRRALRFAFSLSALLLSIVHSACAVAPVSELEGTSWLLESYGPPGQMAEVLEGTNVSLEFERGGVVTGSTGCNAFEGTWKVGSDALTIRYDIGSGPRCDFSAIVEQEQMFLATIILAERYSLDGNALTIDCGERVLVFARRAAT
jgi:heat shock protein HslJ